MASPSMETNASAVIREDGNFLSFEFSLNKPRINCYEWWNQFPISQALGREAVISPYRQPEISG